MLIIHKNQKFRDLESFAGSSPKLSDEIHKTIKGNLGQNILQSFEIGHSYITILFKSGEFGNLEDFTAHGIMFNKIDEYPFQEEVTKATYMVKAL